MTCPFRLSIVIGHQGTESNAPTIRSRGGVVR